MLLSNVMRPVMPAAAFPNPIQRPVVPQAAHQPRPPQPQISEGQCLFPCVAGLMLEDKI